MPKFFFHVDDGTLHLDADGADLPDIRTAKIQAIKAASEMLQELSSHLWDDRVPWTMTITSETGVMVGSLTLTATVPSGRVHYKPEE